VKQTIQCYVIVITNKVVRAVAAPVGFVDLDTRQSIVVSGNGAHSSAVMDRHARRGVFPGEHLRAEKRAQTDEKNQAGAIYIGKQ
jgi:hypothetical protein